MNLLTNPITSQILSIVIAALCGWLGKTVVQLNKRESALYEGVKVLLRKELFDVYVTYIVDGDPLSYERKEEITECYQAYAALGGNGTGRDIYDQLKQLPIQAVERN